MAEEYRYFKGYYQYNNHESLNVIITYCTNWNPEPRRFGLRSLNKPIKVINIANPNGYMDYAFDTIEELNAAGFYLLREISEAEYKMFEHLHTIFREIWMNQLTGGFPKPGIVNTEMRRLKRDSSEYYKEVFGEECAAECCHIYG